jgi:predicted phage terminase large subunit-like protein
MPAISRGEGDALGRAEGVPLWSDQPEYGYAADLIRTRERLLRNGLSYEWESQYQCRPVPAEGAMFRPKEMRILDALPAGMFEGGKVRGWDFAATTRGDWTVGIKLVRLYGSAADSVMWLITDCRRMRGRPDEVRQLVLDVAKSDGYSTDIWLPEDPGQAGKDQGQSYVRMLAGNRVHLERMTGSKETRAGPVASQVNAGNVAMLRAAWNEPLVEELQSFPLGQHDDIVDALSLAFAKLETDKLAQWLRL